MRGARPRLSGRKRAWVVESAAQESSQTPNRCLGPAGQSKREIQARRRGVEAF